MGRIQAIIFTLCVAACGRTPEANSRLNSPSKGRDLPRTHNNSAVVNAADFQSTDGTLIHVRFAVDYRDLSSDKPNQVWLANPILIGVEGRRLTGAERVRVVLVSRERQVGSCGVASFAREHSYFVDLSNERGSLFVGDLAKNGVFMGRDENEPAEHQLPVIHAEGYCYNVVNDGFEIAVVVNGQWLVDPVSRSHNFKGNFSI